MTQKIDWEKVVTNLLITGAIVVFFLLVIFVIYIVGNVTSIPDTDTRNERNISVWHVDEKNVTCFIWRGEAFNGGVDCIPDWQLSQPQINPGEIIHD